MYNARILRGKMRTVKALKAATILTSICLIKKKQCFHIERLNCKVENASNNTKQVSLDTIKHAYDWH